MPEIYLPTLHAFANDNVFTGSCGSLRFRIVPRVIMANPKEADLSASSIDVEYWRGELCYELSQMEEKRTFPMSEQGREEIKQWLELLSKG